MEDNLNGFNFLKYKAYKLYSYAKDPVLLDRQTFSSLDLDPDPDHGVRSRGRNINQNYKLNGVFAKNERGYMLNV